MIPVPREASRLINTIPEIHVEGAEFHAGVVDLVESESVTIRIVASDEIGRLMGDYLLFAVEDTGLEYANPTAMRPYLSKAKPVHIEAHSVYSERIPLAMSTVENHR